MSAEQMNTLEEIRAQIDVIDAKLITLLAERQKYVKRAGEIKPKNNPMAVAAPDRVAQVIAKRREQAEVVGLAPDVAEAVWQAMITAFIAFEHQINVAD
ncbi:chorismate mutase [Neisseria arctica]|uniref:chorismate mutase n=1 Tax=Neisseria arctica TaxID=1470200 RepID=A0A0J1C1L7_9NEIS|nr:chorismate mutase [Neisseria arctica]KLT72178.1 chorismate mutase [Neisseria arctica]UOO87301.1 chorismate mutase [Neisseria arctica]